MTDTAQLLAQLSTLPPEEAIKVMQARGLLTPTFSWMDLWQEEHAHQFTVSRLARLDLLQAVHEGILGSVKGDVSRRDFMRGIQDILVNEGWWGEKEVTDPATGEKLLTTFDANRLKLIYDVNTRQAYAAGKWQRFERNKATSPYLRYITKRDERVRASHREWDNLTLPVDHSFWNTHYPPNGWRCRCRAMSMSQAEYDKGIAPNGQELNKAEPDIEWKDWTNKKTGETQRVPKGIDPGFGYNPGKTGMRQAALEKVKSDKLAGVAEPLRKAAEKSFADNGGMKPNRHYLDKTERTEFYRQAMSDRNYEAKKPISAFTNNKALSVALGKESVNVDEIVLQASYLGHVNDYHAVGGIRKDAFPVTESDLSLLEYVINNDSAPEYTGKTTHTGNPLVKFSQTINGITYKVIGEIREGKKNRNIAVYNFYKK